MPKIEQHLNFFAFFPYLSVSQSFCSVDKVPQIYWSHEHFFGLKKRFLKKQDRKLVFSIYMYREKKLSFRSGNLQFFIHSECVWLENIPLDRKKV